MNKQNRQIHRVKQWDWVRETCRSKKKKFIIDRRVVQTVSLSPLRLGYAKLSDTPGKTMGLS